MRIIPLSEREDFPSRERAKSRLMDELQDGKCPKCKGHIVALQRPGGPRHCCNCPGMETGYGPGHGFKRAA